VAEADPNIVTQPTPLDIDERLRARVTEAVIAQAGIRHTALNAFLRVRLAGTDIAAGALFAEPTVEGAGPYVSSGRSPRDLSGNLLHPRLVDALTCGEEGDDYRFTHPAYAHQLEAWGHLKSNELRSVLVSSGTGSGKTECFLVPLLDDLARESETSGRLGGVRALMLYPLNALIASQEERLRRWTAPFAGDIRFALYNGLMQDRRKLDRDRNESDRPEQVLYRTTLRSDPPPILVTNNTMLEYMTIRREDRPIVEASKGLLRWIVIDEAHSYVGSAAAEVSLLLRRVMEAFDVEPGQVRFVATSATIGSEGETARAELRSYLAGLAGVPEHQVAVVFGQREKVALGGPGLASDPVAQILVRELEERPTTIGDIEKLATAQGRSGRDLLRALASPQASDQGPLLPLRVHQFIRAVPGLWSCLDPACSGGKPDEWAFGSILFEATENCPQCQAPVFEVVSCRECGEPWLQAFDTGDGLEPLATPPDRDEFAATSSRENDAEEPEPTEEPATELRDRRYIATRHVDGELISLTVDPRTGVLPDRRDAGISVQASRIGAEDACPRCYAAAQRDRPHPIGPFRFGAPFLIQNATPTVLEGVTPAKPCGIELPAEGRRLLSFTDSRQGTARFAANIETMAERGFVRAFVYHAVQQVASAGSAVDDATRSKLEQRLAKLRPHSGDPAFDDMIREVEGQLAGGDRASASVVWRAMVQGLSAEPMVKNWIGAVWGEDREERFQQDREALANFLLLRELARRPRRANAIETLGFAKLLFDEIERLSDARLPEAFRQAGSTLGDWRDFLYFLLDSFVRNNFALAIGNGDARWLLPRRAFLRNIVGPREERRIRSDLAWPMAPRSDQGAKSNAILALEAGLNLDSADGQDRAQMDDILQAAWDQLSPLLTGTGSTRALSFERASLAPVHEAWLCPVTNRVLPRLLFGRSPYALRRANRHAAPPQPLVMPWLPLAFPTDERQRRELALFVDTSDEVAKLRERGIWGNLHSRAATFAPFIRAEEHSAQQPPHRLRLFEREFKEGKINLLACSTTMEMGVDIGSIEAVLNTNVPPSIANYRQRVGRAGRRGQGFASSLTFARDTPLDRETFRDPPTYLRREISAPRVKLDSSRIVQRHVNALLLARWFAEAQGELTRARAGTFFGFPKGLGLEPDENPPVSQFIAWLAQPSTAQSVGSAITRLVRGTALEGVTGLLGRTSWMFGQSAEEFGRQWRALRVQASAVAADARRGIEIMVGRMTREFLLRELTNRSLLPGHGFPTAVVPFITDCAEARGRDRRRDEEEGGETQRNRRYDYPSRNANIAIREYAPGAEIVVDGLVWTSAGVTLNWERPAHDEAAREIQSIRWSWLCNECGESGCDRQLVRECSACGSTTVAAEQFLEPAGFRVDWNCRPHAETDQVRYIEPQAPRVSAHQARWEPLFDPALGRCRATDSGTVFYYSLGAGGTGYRICLDCGRAAEDADAALVDHIALMPAKGERGRCPGNDKSFAITRPLALAHEVLTDVAEVQPAALTDPTAAGALISAILEVLVRRLGIETRELGLSVASRPAMLGDVTHSLFLYDQASGGAGYAPRLLDDLAELLREARVVLDCKSECERGCSACVLTADLYSQQGLIDRKAALAFLEPLLESLATPEPADQVAPGAALSPPVADALTRRLRPQGSTSLYTDAEFDLALLADEPFTALFAAVGRAGGSLRFVLPQGQAEQLDEAHRIGLRNAALRHGFELWEGNATKAPNGAVLIADLIQEGVTLGWFSRDPSAGAIGPGWGVGSLHPVVDASIEPLALHPIESERFERTSGPGDKIRIIAAESGCLSRQFGSGIVSRILKEDLAGAGLWKPGQLAAITYSDRYLKAPLPVLLMMQTVTALRTSLAPSGAKVPLAIATEQLRADRYGSIPRCLWNNWPNDDDRAEVFAALAERCGFDLSYNDAAAPHGRKLVIEYDDSTRALILFDQGFGYWRAQNGGQHNFRAPPSSQAKALLDANVLVAGDGESYIAVTRG
jgi:ATP-dependent helicase YprA (DUF1998 family)